MKRIQRVEQYLNQWTEEYFDSDNLHPHRPQGCQAEVVSNALSIDRSNASRDLNALVVAGIAVKISGKPVLFLSSQIIQRLLGSNASCKLEYISWPEFLKDAHSPVRSKCDNAAVKTIVNQVSAFNRLQGNNRTLKKPIELAKAAILYPPQGLHTLLTGRTGVGKTLFAESMYQFAVETGQLQTNAPYIAFNCADYANNPQLLMAQLFGVEKGAYTGADRDRVGMVEKVNGGVLFLDEVHRLPPEGQEMLFQLLDKGIFRRLGETDSHRTSTIRLIAATTENPKSSLLLTFIRRFPILISIPSLAERTLVERYDFIHGFFSEESSRVKRPILVSPEVTTALLLFECPGNVGQLKSEIQLLSALAFLNEINGGESHPLHITLEDASEHVRYGLLKIPERRNELNELLQITPAELLLNGIEADLGQVKEESLYDLLEHQAGVLRQRGLTEEEVINVLSIDIDAYFRNLLQRVSREFQSKRQEIVRIVGESFLDTVEQMFDIASNMLERVYATQTIFGCALHLKSAVGRIQNVHLISNPGLSALRKQAPKEYETGCTMAETFEQRTKVRLPENEIGLLVCILLSVRNMTSSSKVGILVISHGNYIASSMLEVANHLLGTTHGIAIDMPLQADPDLILEQAETAAKQINQGKGILLLVDMGSLLSFGQIIQERTGIPVRAVQNVSTPVVMEAVRKAALTSTTLEQVHQQVLHFSRNFQQWRGPYPPARTGLLP